MENNEERPDEFDQTPQDAGDSPEAVDGYGTTADEQREGEPLEIRLAREQPEGLEAPADEPAGVGRLVDPESQDQLDVTAEAVGQDVGLDAGDFSAEEAAIHVESE